jgi:hypothetical protein
MFDGVLHRTRRLVLQRQYVVTVHAADESDADDLTVCALDEPVSKPCGAGDCLCVRTRTGRHPDRLRVEFRKSVGCWTLYGDALRDKIQQNGCLVIHENAQHAVGAMPNAEMKELEP